jgi:hypothetical protein
MTPIQLVYHCELRIFCPDQIGRQPGERLEQRYTVVYYDWDECLTILGPAITGEAFYFLFFALPLLNPVVVLAFRNSG